MSDDLTIPKRFRTGSTGGHRRWRKQERDLAKQIGGHTTPGSGNQSVKGDVRLRSVARIECKATSAKSFSITQAMVDKITTAALQSGDRVPMIQVDFVDAHGDPVNSVCVMPRYALEMVAGEIIDEPQ